MTELQDQLKQDQRNRTKADMGPAGFYTDPFSPGIAPPPGAPTAPVAVPPPDPAAAQPAAPPPAVPAGPPPKTRAEIDAELGLPPSQIEVQPPPSFDAGTWDVIGAAWRAETIKTDAWNDTTSRRQSLVEEMWNRLDQGGRDRVWQDRIRRGWASMEELITAEAGRQAAASPDVARVWAGLPLSIEDFNRQVDEGRRADLDEAQAVLDQPGGGVAEFFGSAARAITDETSLMLLPLGISGSAWRTIVGEAVLGAAGEAAVLPKEYRVAEELDLPDPSAGSRIALGALFGGGFSAAIIGLGKGARALQARAEARRASLVETIPPGVDRIDHEAGVEAAEAALRGDQTPQERLGGRVEGGARAEAQPAPGTMGDILGKTRSPDTVKVVEAYQSKTRNLPVSDSFKADLRGAVAPLGDDIGVMIVSGGQDRTGRIPGSNRPIGSTRHDVDANGVAHTGDVVLTRNGRPVTPTEDPELYARFLYEAAKVYPGIGHYSWGVHVGGGSVSSWGPDTTSKTLDPYFAKAIEAGRAGATYAPAARSGVTVTLPEIGPDAPAGWTDPVRRGILATESGGDFDALFGFSNRPGGKWSNIKPSKMTVDQWLEFQRPEGPYGQWVAANRPDKENGVSTPMGGYQIVGDTLAMLKRDLNLRGDEVMTPEFQEYLAQQIFIRQGTGAWQGYKGPRGDWTPGSTDGPAPAMGPTSRGYTGQNQIAYGDDKRIDVDYEVVDYRSLIRASGDYQPRDRSRINSDEWVAATAARLDPAQLMPSPNAATGTPIVGPDNMIESGNGRTMAIGRAYELHPDRAQAYRGAIEAAGFEVPAGMERPVLIARRKTEFDETARKGFVVDAQDSGIARMNATEMALAYRGGLTSTTLARLKPGLRLSHPDNADFARAAMATLSRSERNAFFGKGGQLNGSGERALQELMFARAWDAPDILAKYTEITEDDLIPLIQALAKAAPNWAALKSDIEAGLVPPEMDISLFVQDAVRLIDDAREMAAKGKGGIGQAISDIINSPDMLEGAISPLTVRLVKVFWRDGRSTPTDKIVSFLKRYADEARKVPTDGDGMFDAPGPRDILRTIDPEIFKDLPEDFGTARTFARPGQEAPVEAVADRQGDDFDQGAQSPAAEAVHAEIEAELRGPSLGEPTVSRQAGTFAEAREAVKEFQGRALRNEATGIEATVSRNALDKMLSQSAVAKSTSPELHTRAIANIDTLFAASRLGWSKPDRAGNPNIAAVHRYFVPMKSPDGRPALVKMTVKQDAREGRANPLYTIEAVEFLEGSSAVKWVDAAAVADAGTSPKAIRPAEDVLNMARRVDDFNSKPPTSGAGRQGTSDTPPGTIPAANPDMPLSRPADEALAPIDTAALAIDRARSDLGEFAALDIDLPDGTRVRAGDILDDIDADRTADAVAQACAVAPNGGA
jgi:hypothetical protein